jgi:hypothetical protein
MARARGSKTEAAKLLGIPRTTLNSRLARAERPDSPRTVEGDRALARARSELGSIKALYTSALALIETLERDREALCALREHTTSFAIRPSHPSGTSEGTVVLVASDWHMEETVGPEVLNLNTYSPEIAVARATKFFQAGLRLTRLLQQDIKVPTIVLALLGDFITNQIHEAESAEKNALLPTQAIVLAQKTLISGIEFLLEHTKAKLTIPCHSGNHARTTKKTRFSSENGHSLEYLMYLHLAAYFKSEPRVSFLIPEGLHSYLDIYGRTIRFHHGHAIKYGGGVGGIYVPVLKALSQWNKAIRADLDVFGHFHQLRDGGSFICNGSLVGYNGFALSIRADFEEPKQALFLMDKKRGRTCLWPILTT